ncbi:MAG: MBL fold metallo-hydrolase [Pseudomonadales bacterium]|nr:MBL fold metallo-hydrolase [Pseudomonadales bacterium]
MKRLAPLVAPILLACSSLLFAAPAVEHLRLSVIPTAVSSGAAEAMVVSGGRWTTERHLGHAAVLIEHPKGRFLFDTGLGRQTAEAFARNNWINRTLLAYEQLNPARDQLEAAGYSADDIDFILPSHLHWDHLGGLPDFPGIPVKVLPGALEEARDHGEPPAFLAEQLEGQREWQQIELDNTPYQGFEQSLDLFGDGQLILVDLSGHTAGQAGLFVNLPSGKRLFLIGDTSWTERGVERNKPRPVFVQWLSHVDSDRERNSQQLKRVHELHQRDPELLIIPAHDEFVAAGLTRFPAFEE